MLKIAKENHLICFDRQNQYIVSYAFEIVIPQSKKKDEAEGPKLELKNQYTVNFFIHHQFDYKWNSQFFDLEVEKQDIAQYGQIPFSIETFLQIYKNPHHWTIKLRPRDDEIQLQNVVGKMLGKLVIWTTFKQNPFLLPVGCRSQALTAQKYIKVIINANDNDEIICSAEGHSVDFYETTNAYKERPDQSIQNGFIVYTFLASERVDCENICILKGKFDKKQLKHQQRKIFIYSPQNIPIKFIPNLQKIMKMLKFVDNDILIVQNVDTFIEDSYRLIFYTDLSTLYSKVFRSFLYSRIYEKWVIEGMIHFNRDNRHFQDCLSEVTDLLSEGEQLFPLQNSDYCFDYVWKVKAKFIYHIFANLSQSNLTETLIKESNKRKLTIQMILKKMKDQFGLQKLKTIYEQQFINSTGINRIFYEMEHYKRDHKIKITLRQKALGCNIFRKYNRYRIKLEEQYDMVSPIMKKIIEKNGSKKQQLFGPLAIPKFLKCIPYFVGKLSVQIENSEPFMEQLQEQNITEKITDVKASLRPRKQPGKKSEQDASDTISWMMLDTGLCFPAVYKGKNLSQSVIEGLVKRTYESQIEELKVLNSISIRDHSQSPTICKLLIEKIKIYPTKQNTKISVKRKILQLLPMFISKSKDVSIWQELLSLLKLYEPVCYDFSEEGNLFLHSLIESIGSITYTIEMSFFFDQFHRLFLSISRYHQSINEEKFQQIHKQLFKSMMKWVSKYSLQILEEAHVYLGISFQDHKRFKSLIKIIIENVLPYIDTLKLNNAPIVSKINKAIEEHIELDKNGQIRSVYFHYTTKMKEKSSQALQFLTGTFKQLEEIKDKHFQAYDKCLQAFKDVIGKRKQRYGLDIQVEELNENQNYFLAEYLWNNMCSPESLNNAQIRLAWIKIYRIFYFYFTPIITMVKLKKNFDSREFDLNESQTKQILDNIMDFVPDIHWFSVYDSSNNKAKRNVENIDQGRRKKREIEEFTFEDDERNHFTEYIKDNPGKDTWEDLSKEALKILYTQYENKDIANIASNDDRYKRIVDDFKGLANLLKRGNTPTGFSYEKLKQKIYKVLDDYEEDYEFTEKVLDYLERTLDTVERKKKEKQLQKNTGTTVKLKFDDFFS